MTALARQPVVPATPVLRRTNHWIVGSVLAIALAVVADYFRNKAADYDHWASGHAQAASRARVPVTRFS